ncbi:transcription regulator, AsnC family 5 [Thermococcus cleftensis]|uniref:Transcription regulator, AsnC family 5 n=1 Tax=Thermococcus cleftensis (strain DSM 27260 / KACC 17922 / CL1) TaxID=163003 RepID=I3ZWZ7_THECF|nr:Lrp/AsnC family transcriptional regulator [Thermococcus cleftensis]AFL96231.1 transcription regulator, AsnC family 5 [Thermococcus cleftensis]
MVQLDDLDRAILRILKEDARLTISEIAERLNRPESTIHFRIKKLQEKGIIDRYTIVLGKDLQPKALAVVYIQAETPIIEDFLERYILHIMKTLSLLPNVLAVARSGRDGVIALIGEESQEKLNRFVDETIKVLPTLKRVEVLPITDITKGNGIVGFLVDV